MAIDSAVNFAEAPQLDESLYCLDPKDVEFFKKQTGITDDEELKELIISVSKEAYKVFPYPCIRLFVFTNCRMAHLPAYPQLLRLGQERKNPILLDLGCCFGIDVRKAISDGFPVSRAIGSDLRAGFWEMGHKLFKTTPETFPVPFVAGDIFDTEFISDSPIVYGQPPTEAPVLSELKSLNPVKGHVSAINACNFFHLFNEERQLLTARRLASLLSPEPGSMILGEHSGFLEKGVRRVEKLPLGVDDSGGIFSHSAESWKELWENTVFEKGKVRVDVVLEEEHFDDRKGGWSWLKWSVTRI